MEKYTKLKTLPEMLYAEGSPVIIMAGALLRANETEKILAQFKFKNITNRRIHAVFIRIHAFDISGRQLEGLDEFQYLDLSVSRDEEFGSRKAVLLPDSNTRNIRVECTQVIFDNGDSWTSDSCDWDPLADQKKLESGLNDREMLKQFRIKYGSNTYYYLAEEKGIWRCTCGAVNISSEAKCHICGQLIERLKNYDENKLLAEKNDRLEAERAEKERRTLAEKIEAEKQAEADRIKKQKSALAVKKACIFLAIALVAIFIIYTVGWKVIPYVRYANANKALESQNYDKAYAAFSALDDYKDSAEKATESVYQKAAVLKDEGSFKEAAEVYLGITDYKDSSIQAALCLNQAAYLEADALIDKRDYKAAAEAFSKLGTFLDSVSRAKDASYLYAVSLFESGQYEEAESTFKALEGYKDCAEQIEKCETAIKDSKYNDALELYNAGEYEEAISLFKELEGYKDSEDRLINILRSDEWKKICPAGGTIFFGSYEQDNDTSNGKEDIEWLVLAKEGNRILLISKYALDCQHYNTTITNVTWETCSLRRWLNRSFLNAAFNSKEQSIISKNTSIFLLNVYEANKYFSSDEERKCMPSAYAKEKNCYSPNGYCWWWLRTPGESDSDRAAIVLINGKINRVGYMVYDPGTMGLAWAPKSIPSNAIAVRPALWIILDS